MSFYSKTTNLLKSTALLCTLTATSASVVHAAETITFPARSSNLAPNSYWAVSEFSEGCCTLDLNVHRWNGSSWPGGNPGIENSDDYTWNVPLYSPANGRVISCWRNSPDNPKQGSANKLPQVNNSANSGNGITKTIFGGGNHIVIITDENNVISLNHFKQGSIPASLCPPNNDGTVNVPTMAKEDGWRSAAYIEPADRPRVLEGQFLGRAGNSGNSTGPHLHISMKRVTSTPANGREVLSASSVPLQIRQAWAHRYENNSPQNPEIWFRQRGEGFSEAGNPSKKMLHPSPYLRRADKSGGSIKPSMATLFMSSNRFVTASIGSTSNKLKLIGWDLVGVNSINRRGDIEAGSVKSVHLAKPATNFVLAAVRQSNDALKMIAYHVTITGGFQRTAQFTAGGILAIDMATTRGPDRKAVTAVRTKTGNLKLIVWDIKFGNDGQTTIDRLGEIEAGAIDAVSISRARNFNGVFTAVRTGGKLRVIPWKISADGMTLTRGTHVSAGTIGADIDVVALSHGVAVGVKDTDGNLRIVTWSASSNGNIGARRSTRVAHKTQQIRLLESPHGKSNFTSVVQGQDGNLYLIGWGVDSDGRNLRRLGSSKAGAISGFSADVVSKSFPGLDPRDIIMTSVRDGDGKLKLVTWDTNLNKP